MSFRSIDSVKALSLLFLALGFLEVGFMTSRISVMAQSNQTATPAAQEAKPFDQEQALVALRKAIAGKEKMNI